jgi:hypothetical protein
MKKKQMHEVQPIGGREVVNGNMKLIDFEVRRVHGGCVVWVAMQCQVTAAVSHYWGLAHIAELEADAHKVYLEVAMYGSKWDGLMRIELLGMEQKKGRK